MDKEMILDYADKYLWVPLVILIICVVAWQVSTPPKYSSNECLEYCRLLYPITTHAHYTRSDSCVCEYEYNRVCTPDNLVCTVEETKKLGVIVINETKK